MPQPYIPQEMIDEIRSRVDLVEVVSEAGIALRRSGKNFFGLCPFHQEDTPSFAVSPERQWYRCFGCNESGNVFHFLMKTQGLTFPEAVQLLADRVGVRLPGTGSGRHRPQVAGLRELHDFAVQLFHRQLLDHRTGEYALRYLRDRGVKMDTIEQFKLGFAPPGNDRFLKQATRAGFSIQLLLEGGLIKERQGSRYDTFRNRIMFPIEDTQGHPVAFGGRALDDSPAKYLNSPETPIYQKSRLIYNLARAREAIQEAREAILVEGYMDVLIPYQEGIRNIVASLGTALTEHHARLLRRYADQVVITYDGDQAGLRAAQRGLQLLLQEGLRVRVGTLPSGMDPDDLVKQRGAAALHEVITSATHLVDFQLHLVARQRNLYQPEGRAEAVKELADLLSCVQSYVELAEYVRRAAGQLMIDEPLLWAELRRLGVQIRRPSRPASLRRPRREPPRVRIERELLACVFQQPSLIEEAKQQIAPADFSHPEFAQIARLLWEWEGGNSPIDSLIERCEDEHLRDVMISLVWHSGIVGEIRDHFYGCLSRLRDYTLKELELSRRRQVAERNDLDSLKELLELRARRKKGGRANGEEAS